MCHHGAITHKPCSPTLEIKPVLFPLGTPATDAPSQPSRTEKEQSCDLGHGILNRRIQDSMDGGGHLGERVMISCSKGKGTNEGGGNDRESGRDCEGWGDRERRKDLGDRRKREREREKYLIILNSIDSRKNIYFNLFGRNYASYISLSAPTQKLILNVNMKATSLFFECRF